MKSLPVSATDHRNWSLPVRERGLKSAKSHKSKSNDASLPVRERGLKSDAELRRVYSSLVAPRAGAWIEIYLWYYYGRYEYVAPRAGAWIEMKHQQLSKDKEYVAPRAGAWIEISCC